MRQQKTLRVVCLAQQNTVKLIFVPGIKNAVAGLNPIGEQFFFTLRRGFFLTQVNSRSTKWVCKQHPIDCVSKVPNKNVWIKVLTGLMDPKKDDTRITWWLTKCVKG